MRKLRTRKALSLGLGLACGAAIAVVGLGVLGSDDGSGEGGTADTATTQQTGAVPVARSTQRKRGSRGPRARASRNLRPPRLQKRGSIDRIKPTPRGKQARGDRGAIWDRGCMLLPDETASKACAFGKRKSNRSVILWGDSHAMAFFGMMNRVANRRGWRLVGLVKAGCPPNHQDVYNPKVDRVFRECKQYHRYVMRRIEREDPQMIFTASALTYKPMVDGRIVPEGVRRRKLMRDGYESMLQRLSDVTDARLVALKDVPQAPHDMTDCVGANLDNLRKCAFKKSGRFKRTWEAQAARSVRGVWPVDVSPGICNGRRCFGVIRNRLVYRDDDHLTATFARSLAPRLAHALRRRSG